MIGVVQSDDLQVEGFTLPDFRSDVDFNAHIRRTPETATVKGMFFSDLRRLLQASMPAEDHAGIPLSDKRYPAFGDYACHDYLRLMEHSAGALYPYLPTSEAVRRIGWSGFPKFVESLVGRVVVGIFLDDFDRLVQAMAKSWRYVTNIGEVTAQKQGPQDWLCEVRDCPGMVVPNFVGGAEGIFRHYQLEPTVTVRLMDAGNFDMSIRWVEDT